MPAVASLPTGRNVKMPGIDRNVENNIIALRALIERVQPRRAYLTHVSHRLDYEATNARLPPHVKLAHDGLQLP